MSESTSPLQGKWGGSTGLLDDYIYEIDTAKFVSREFGCFLILNGTAVEDGGAAHPEHEVRLGCGKKFEPVDGGKRAVHTERGESEGFNEKSGVQRFLVAAVELGAPFQDRSDDPCDAAMWEGLRFRIKITKDSFESDEVDENGKRKVQSYNVTLPSEYLGEVGEASGKGSAPARASASAGNGAVTTDPKLARVAARSAEDWESWFDTLTEQGWDPKDPRIAQEGPESIWEAIRG